jgi:glycosyltransferase A (GT-A) superfamily protein (DUF2064 family)
VKRPLPGHAKTRLGATPGHDEAADTCARLLYAHSIDVLHADLGDTQIELSSASPDDLPYFRAAFPEWSVRPHVAGGLAERMAASFARAFSEGPKRMQIINALADIAALGKHLSRSRTC